MPESVTGAFEPATLAVAAAIDGAMTGGGGVPIRKETYFAAEVLPVSVAIVTTHA